ncbi:MAG TPA: transporter substrate-binding domain-containing protein [Deinococcales bacterium]|nr:transporter substrate-binding domain-containing protein [Deinococcales bacterium]
MTNRFLILFFLLFLAAQALAQQAPLGPEYTERDRLRLEGDSLRFCVISDNLPADYHRELATELAATQLLEARIVEVDPPRPSEPLDYRLFLEEAQLYYLLANDCEVFMGLALTSSLSRWDWLLTSQPYHVSHSVFVTRDEQLTKWTDLPLDETIGTRVQTSSDIQLATYLTGLSENRRWKRVPNYNNEQPLVQLAEGKIGLALVWEPAVVHFMEEHEDAADFRTLPTEPLGSSQLQLGLGLRSQDSFLQASLDTAISELEALGILDELATRYDLPTDPLP